MFANIEVFSRENLIAHSAEVSRPSVIISISDKNGQLPIFDDNPNIVDILYLFFDDEECGPDSMSCDDAQQIVDFLDAYQEDGLDLLIHCGAGVSRSAGCAAAVMLIEWGDDKKIFSDGKYCPNMHCYRTILDVADVTYDNIELAKKEKAQFDLWRIEHADDLFLN